jgi:hypothetical protein
MNTIFTDLSCSSAFLSEAEKDIFHKMAVDLEQELEAVKSKNRNLKDEVQALKDDIQTIKTVARKKFETTGAVEFVQGLKFELFNASKQADVCSRDASERWDVLEFESMDVT